MRKMLDSSWVTTTMVTPRLSRSSRMSSSIRRAVGGSRPAEGSSRKRSSGSSAMARASAARFCMPPLSWLGIELLEAAQPDEGELEARQGRARRRAAGPAISSIGNITFSSSVIELHSAPDWNSTPKRRSILRRSSALPWVRLSSRWRISPPSGASSPMSARSSVLFPEPLPPMIDEDVAAAHLERSGRRGRRTSRSRS